MQELLIPTKIIRSKRRSIALIIENNGDFIVRAPILADVDSIYKYINQKANWIIKKRIEQIKNQPKPLYIEDNATIHILGKEYTIKITEITRVKVADNIIYLPSINSKEKLINYLKKFAKITILNLINDICKKYSFKYTSFSINSAKSRWGSCSVKNKLHFTYKLMLCPTKVVEYIVIHELCHTKVKNHREKFWHLVESCYPDYRNCEKWLKQNRAIVELI